ncbi:MAG: glycosyltransferase family 4 protein [Chthoniobacterales bacterium]
MKFVFLSSYAHLVLDPSSKRVSGGAELQIALLAKELAARGHEAVLIGGDIGQADNTVFQGVRTRNGGKFHTGNMREMLSAIPRVTKVLREERGDYVFILGWTAWLFILYLLRKPLHYKLGFICGLDTEVNGEYRRTNPVTGGLFEYALRRLDVRFAMTRLQESLFQKNGMGCHLYRNLILPRQNPLTDIPPKDIDLLWIARCQKIKRPHLFLDLAEACPEARCEMVCPAEDAELFASIEARAKTLSNVTFLERVPYHEVQDHYDRARLFVNTSDWEGWPNSFIQAGQGYCGILSLSVKPDTLFEDYALGELCQNDTERLKNAAQTFLPSKEKTDALGREARRFVDELHNNSRETDRFLQGLPTP